MCTPTLMRSMGAGLYILGMLVAGVMFIVIGAEYGENTPSNDDLNVYFWVYAISMLLAAIGLVVDNGNRFCGEEEFKGVDYFGGLFQICAVFTWAALGVGFAHYYSDDVVGNAVTALAAFDERSALAWLSGVAAIFFAFGSLFMLKEILCCEGFSCNMMTIFEIANMVLQIALIVFWFLFADVLNKETPTASEEDNHETYAYLIGIIFIIMALLGAFLFLDLCCGGSDDKPSYGSNDGYDDGYGKNDGYGNTGGGYGDDTTTGYGQQPQPPLQSGY